MSNDTMVTLVGNAATAVEHRHTQDGVPVARLRVAATSRRYDKARACWTDGETSFYTVRAWRALADHVAASVAVGEPLIVQGRLRVREGESSPDRGGQRWVSADVDAVAIGHDLTRGTAAFRRVVRARTDAGGQRPAGEQQSAPHTYGGTYSDDGRFGSEGSGGSADGPVAVGTGMKESTSGIVDSSTGTTASGAETDVATPGTRDSGAGSDSPEKVPVS